MMSMSKKDFIALADVLRLFINAAGREITPDEQTLLSELADFCAAQNPRFHRERWLGYIAGTNGPNGGKVKVTA